MQIPHGTSIEHVPHQTNCTTERNSHSTPQRKSATRAQRTYKLYKHQAPSTLRRVPPLIRLFASSPPWRNRACTATSSLSLSLSLSTPTRGHNDPTAAQRPPNLGPNTTQISKRAPNASTVHTHPPILAHTFCTHSRVRRVPRGRVHCPAYARAQPFTESAGAAAAVFLCVRVCSIIVCGFRVRVCVRARQQKPTREKGCLDLWVCGVPSGKPCCFYVEFPHTKTVDHRRTTDHTR